MFLPSTEALFHNHRCIFLTSVATAFVPRSSVQELRRRILSSVREYPRCTFLTAFATTFVPRSSVQEFLRHILSSMQEFLRHILSSVREYHRCTFLTAFTIAFVVRELRRCTFLTAFTIAFVVRELRRCILPLAQELLWCILLTAFAPCLHFAIINTRAPSAHHSHSRRLATISCPL